MAKKLDPEILAHLEWLGFVQPTGLVVSATALCKHGAHLNRNDQNGQRLLKEVVETRVLKPGGAEEPLIADFPSFASKVLGWKFSAKGYAGTDECPIPDELVVHLKDYEEILEPDYAIIDRYAEDLKRSPWQLLIRVTETAANFDRAFKAKGQLEASHHARMERLLRQTEVSAGLLCNGQVLRLISAPRGESSGWLDFKVADMLETAGRPICSAMRLLLSEQRLLAKGKNDYLASLLEESRKYQNEVSERLAEQVLHALYELMRGLQAAHDNSRRELLREVLDEDPDMVYRSLLTVVLRLVFLLYAEEREMLPRDDDTFMQHYSLAGLFERLRSDAVLFPDTMDQRYGAWAQLLVLFRMVYDGAPDLGLPQRHGELFDPDRYAFLEGRRLAGSRQIHHRIEAPQIPDGTLYRVLDKLLILDGERLSYRALDVEQIGSVYETMMGFKIETATGTSVAIKAQKKGGAPTTIDLDQLCAVPGGKRQKWVLDRAGRKLTKTVTDPLKAASTIEELHAALGKTIDKAATPDLVSKGSLVLQPSEARRKSGSHYTPRELTEPIVRTTLRPILERLCEEAGGPPTPEQILDLKVCDPAMGSGAFLVEACRQLGDALIEAWTSHDARPSIPADEDEVIHARRLVAQRCLYGVDRNPVAVDLAKVSLWLATLARDHAFTFVDHALRHGDSLVGLTNAQIAARDWSGEEPINSPRYQQLKSRVDEVVKLRRRIREAGDELSDWELRDLLDEAEDKAREVRTWGDLIIEAFFSADKDKARKKALAKVSKKIGAGVLASERGRLDELRRKDPPLATFHWELEFPEVFDRQNPGFDALVGNPPFAGQTTVSQGNLEGYIDWLQGIHLGAHGNSDLVAHMFRRAFSNLRDGGTLGLIATNTIAQGNTRGTGLRWICQNAGSIYEADRRRKWPGQAAVVVSVVHVHRGTWKGMRRLDNTGVDRITAFLFHRGGNDDPLVLKASAGQSFQGAGVVGMGFTFDDNDKQDIASSLDDMERLIVTNPKNSEVIFPYIGGEEVNDSPAHSHHRFIINFGERIEEDCRRQWPDLMTIVETKVKPEREASLAKKYSKDKERRAKFWWRFSRPASDLSAAIVGLKRVLVICRHQPHWVVAVLPHGAVFAESLIVFPFAQLAVLALLQSRPHELWARFFGSSMKDDLRYTPSDCFETFPFPEGWQTHPDLEAAGATYYDFRAQLMVETNLGLTKTYNRFHDPDEDDPKIVQLRELHAAMDRAVLDAYGWTDIPTDCKFLLDYEEEEEEGRKRKKPWRYRWPDEVRDEVLARLLELNAQRAAEEAAAAVAGKVGETGDLF